MRSICRATAKEKKPSFSSHLTRPNYYMAALRNQGRHFLVAHKGGGHLYEKENHHSL